jgi:sugar phosphate permease
MMPMAESLSSVSLRAPEQAESAEPGILSSWRFRVFVAAWVMYAAYYFCRKNFSVVMPMMTRTLRYGDFDLAHLVFAFSLAYAAGQFLAGMAADRYGPRVVATCGGLLSAACSTAMAFSGSYHAFLLLQIGNGIGQGCGWSSCLKMLGAWFSRRERGVVMAWWGTCYVLGGFLATVFATYVATQAPIATALEWRRGFLFPAVILTAAAVFFGNRTRSAPADAGVPAASPPEPANTSEESGWWTTAKNPKILTLAGMYFFLKITRYSLLFWLPLYLVQRMQYSERLAGYTSSLFELVGFLGTLIAGYVSDKMMRGQRYPVGAVMLFGLAAALLMHPVLARLGPLATALSVSLLGILTYGPDLLMSGAASVDAVSPSYSARAVGIVNGVGSLGQLISAYVVAGIASRFGWDQLFTFFVVCAVAAAALLTLRCRHGAPAEATAI